MSQYLHGAYGQIQAVGTRVADESQGAIVYVGTAPVHTVEGGEKNVNVPILVNNIAEARKYFGYSDDWAGYTLCEAMHVHLDSKGVGPLVLINVLDPKTHRGDQQGNVNMAPNNGRIIIASAENIIVDSIVVKDSDDEKTYVRGKDYSVAYNSDKKSITIAEAKAGVLGNAELKVTYDTVDPSKVTEADVIGKSDGLGGNTGLFAIKNVYPVIGVIPSFLAAPGFSSIPAVHTAMSQNSVKINGHWDAYMFVDLPIVDKEKPITMDGAKAFKDANGYTNENETVYFPMAEGVNGKVYHLSVLAAANFQELLLDQDGIPYKTASNTECALIQNLYLGEANRGRVYDDSIINEQLNKNGIASAAYVGGRWAIWGCHSADYNQEDADQINVSETNRMMLYYLSNDFQHRRAQNADKPITKNDMLTIIAEEQTRLDALLSIGALTYGVVALNADAQARSDVMNGDYSFMFNITTTPLAKSLTAIVNWTDDGFVTYFESVAAAD